MLLFIYFRQRRQDYNWISDDYSLISLYWGLNSVGLDLTTHLVAWMLLHVFGLCCEKTEVCCMRNINHCNVLKFPPFYFAMMNVFIMFHVLICISGLEC